MADSVRIKLRAKAPDLTREIDLLARQWLTPLLIKLQSPDRREFRPKQINDPIWGTIELAPWEVALLDTPLLQRMRGVRQLGLAQLVFPSACHDRLEHILGVVGAVEQCVQSLSRQIERWNRDHQNALLPEIELKDRYAIRLAALLHDIGHGPFSHALEPVLETTSPLDGATATSSGWRSELTVLQRSLKDFYTLNAIPSVSEVLAVMIVLSEAMAEVLANDKLFLSRGRSAEELQEFIIAAIIGGVTGPGAGHLSGLVSSQIDADKLDYLARDAHHAGLDIGFDTDRLLSRLEILRVTPENVDSTAPEVRLRAANNSGKMFLQVGIAASGFGSFEQMLIGRTFLYDRLYHHHKVRSAEAMAQRLMLVAERDRGRRFDLAEIFLGVGDETMLRILSGDVQHRGLVLQKGKAASLAQGILDRELFHRAFAFRGRFIAAPPGLSSETTDKNRRVLWRRIVSNLGGLRERYELGCEIHLLALRCAQALEAAEIDREEMVGYARCLGDIGPEQVIVDVPALKADRISILARFPNGALKIPEFSFNPVKWSDAYELQKRTGYVYCPRGVVEIVGLASKIVFLARFGVVMSNDADGFIKATSQLSPAWLAGLVRAQLIDQKAADRLALKRHSLLAITPDDLAIPEPWIVEDSDIADRTTVEISKYLSGGLTADDIASLTKVLEAFYAFIDMWFDGGHASRPLQSEEELQRMLRDAFALRGLSVDEGTKVGGGKLDLFVEEAVLVENKFHTKSINPTAVAAAAGMQGRRYAISLRSQVVIVLLGYEVRPGSFPSKSETMTIHGISTQDLNRVEIRFSLPYGAVAPSSEKADRSAR